MSQLGCLEGGKSGPDDLNLVLNRVKIVVAADGGAATSLIESGRVPDAVIGDFDSLESEVRKKIPADRLFPIREQDSTDFDKSTAQRTRHLWCWVPGFWGGGWIINLLCLTLWSEGRIAPAFCWVSTRWSFTRRRRFR